MTRNAVVPFNVPHLTGDEERLIAQALARGKLSGGGELGRECETLLSRRLGGPRCLLTTSCTHALEMIALLLGVGPGDEVLAPSFTFVSTVNAFVLRGASVRFVDVAAPSLNATAREYAAAIGPRTRAIVAVNYGGGGADLEELAALARARGVALVEDAAQSIGSSWAGKPYGTFGALAAFSFHETKNVQCGEGGALVVNDPALVERAEILREKGTNRSQFIRGHVDKYTWVDLGSSYVQSEVLAAFLLAQLRAADDITARRVALWRAYAERFDALGVPYVAFPDEVACNGHVFGVFAPSAAARAPIMTDLKDRGIQTTFHYVPLHASPFGRRVSTFSGSDARTLDLASRLIRLPIYPDLSVADLDRVVDAVAPHLVRRRVAS